MAAVVAYAGVVLAGDCAQAEEWLDYVLQLYAHRFLPCLGLQGENHEGVLYWRYGGRMIVQYADLMRVLCGVDLFTHPWLARTARFPMYCAPPGGYAVSFSDLAQNGFSNHGNKGPLCQDLVAILAARTANPCAYWYAGTFPQAGKPEPRPPVDWAPSILYRQIGWAIFNTSLVDAREGVTVAMHSGKYQTGHQHADQNSFVINAYGEKLAVDGGYYDWYGSPHFKAYSTQSVAHNTILVDGEGQTWNREGADGCMRDWFDSLGYGYAVGDASAPELYGEKLNRFERRLLFVKPGLVVIHDNLEAAGSRARFDWLLHAQTAQPIHLETGSRAFRIRQPGAELLGEVLAPRELNLRVGKSYSVLPMEPMTSKPMPEGSVEPEWTLTATPKTARKAEEFLAVMQIRRCEGGRSAPVAADVQRLETSRTIGARVVCGECNHLILFRKAGAVGNLKFMEVETDGEAVALALDGRQKLLRAFVAQASFLQYRNRTLFAADGPCNRELEIGRKPSAGKAPGIWLQVNRQRQRLEGFQSPQADGVLKTWWGSFEVPEESCYDVSWTGATQRVSLNLDNRTLLSLKPGSGSGQSLWLKGGKHCLTLTSRGKLKGITVQAKDSFRAVDAVVLPENFQPSAEALVIEAERPWRKGGRPPRVRTKVGASGNLASCSWQYGGMWAEWRFEVPRRRRFELLIRSAGIYNNVLRGLELDGEMVPGKNQAVRLQATAGWCRKRNDWRYFAVADEEGRRVAFELPPGSHRLKLFFMAKPANLDCFVLEPCAEL
jgi:hypothetical protein